MPYINAGISRLEIVRKQRGVRAVELARAVGVAPSHISQIERGWRTPSSSVMERAASALRTPVSELFPPSATPALLTGATDRHLVNDDSAAPGTGCAVETSGTCEGRARRDEQ